MIIASAMALEALLGESKWLWSRLPRPAVLIRHGVEWIGSTFNTGGARQAKGVIAMIGLASGALLVGLLLHAVPGRIIDLFCLALLLGQRTTCDHLAAVGKALPLGMDPRQPDHADATPHDATDTEASGLARSAIETGAEALSSTVIAPLFWFFLGGLPGLLFYTVTHVASSAIGQLSDFGWAAARLHMVLNWVPARITAALILTVTWRWDLLDRVLDDAPTHPLPNAGWPDAAMAHALNVALGGPRPIGDHTVDLPWLNASGIHDLAPRHIDEAVIVLWKTWGLVLAIAALPWLALALL